MDHIFATGTTTANTGVKNSELNPDLTASGASARAAKVTDKSAALSDDESEKTITVTKKHIRRTKDLYDDSQTASATSALTFGPKSTSFLDHPVAWLQTVERRTWVQLAVLIFAIFMGVMLFHPTAYYRVQLYLGNCVEIPGRTGLVHKICPPQTIPHPLA